MSERYNVKRRRERMSVAVDETLKSEQWELRIERNGDR